MSDLFDNSDLNCEFPQDVVVDEQFVIVPQALYARAREWGPLALAVYVGLRAYANRKRGMTTWVAVNRIAEDLNMGVSTVRREIGRLCDEGWVKRDFKKGRPTTYWILQTPPLYRMTPPLYSATPPQNENITICINQKKLTRGEIPPSEDVDVAIPIEEIFNYYLEKLDRNKRLYTLTPKRKKMGLERWKDAIKKAKDNTPENARILMETAIDGLAGSKFHQGENDRKKKYIDWEIIFRSTDKFEYFLNMELDA